MKKQHKDYIELTIGQLILVVLGASAFIVFGALWLNGALWAYGMPLA